MQNKLLKTLGLAALVAVSPIAVMAQDSMAPPPPADPMPPEGPAEPTPPTNPPQPGEPTPKPRPTDPTTPPMPGEPMQPSPQPTEPVPDPVPPEPMQNTTNAPVGPMATPPGSNAPTAQSGGTTSSTMTPQPATKEYPLCTREIQDSCRNPGEGPKRSRPR